MGKLKYVIPVVLSLAATACTSEDLASLNTGDGGVAEVSAPPSPTPSDPPQDCWFDHVAINGGSNLPYPGESQAAGNTFYACYGDDSNGVEQGIWLAFYADGTSYYGLPGVTVTPTKNTSNCRLDWSTYGHAVSANLNESGHITQVSLYADQIGEMINFACTVED